MGILCVSSVYIFLIPSVLLLSDTMMIRRVTFLCWLDSLNFAGWCIFYMLYRAAWCKTYTSQYPSNLVTWSQVKITQSRIVGRVLRGSNGNDYHESRTVSTYRFFLIFLVIFLSSRLGKILLKGWSGSQVALELKLILYRVNSYEIEE